MTTQATSEITAEPTAVVPARPQAPSVHMRVLITWLAIFPLVSLGMLLLGPIMEPWHPILRALVLTAFVVPTAVYFVVPRLFAGHGALSRKAVERAARKSA
jgi:antibiotic biosynthesis monooxygenase (ABM) superfamily enzyme